MITIALAITIIVAVAVAVAVVVVVVVVVVVIIIIIIIVFSVLQYCIVPLSSVTHGWVNVSNHSRSLAVPGEPASRRVTLYTDQTHTPFKTHSVVKPPTGSTTWCRQNAGVHVTRLCNHVTRGRVVLRT